MIGPVAVDVENSQHHGTVELGHCVPGQDNVELGQVQRNAARCMPRGVQHPSLTGDG